MSEVKDGAHGRVRYGEKSQRDLLGGAELPTHRRRFLPQAQGQETLDSLILIENDNVKTKEDDLSNNPSRSLWFKRGTRFYSTEFPVPKSPIEEQNRRAGQLEDAKELEINESSLIFSEKEKKWVVKAKKEHKTKEYGAFIMVNVHSIDRRGKDQVNRRFISLKGLQKPEDNPFARFKKLTS